MWERFWDLRIGSSKRLPNQPFSAALHCKEDVRHLLSSGIEEERFGLRLECTSLGLFATTLGNLEKRYDLKTSKDATLTE